MAPIVPVLARSQVQIVSPAVILSLFIATGEAAGFTLLPCASLVLIVIFDPPMERGSKIMCKQSVRHQQAKNPISAVIFVSQHARPFQTPWAGTQQESGLIAKRASHSVIASPIHP
jgi:hypothetical protein